MTRLKLSWTPHCLWVIAIGTVIALGEVSDFRLGDRVVSNGPHAELVAVPHRPHVFLPVSPTKQLPSRFLPLLVCRVSSQPTLGECFVVSGLGLIGLPT